MSTLSDTIMRNQITCTFKVPENENATVVSMYGIVIKFGDILDPSNTRMIHTGNYETGREEGHVGDMYYTQLSEKQAKAALVHYYKNSVLPDIDHPDKESDQFFYTWMLAALPQKLSAWNVDKWREAFSQE